MEEEAVDTYLNNKDYKDTYLYKLIIGSVYIVFLLLAYITSERLDDLYILNLIVYLILSILIIYNCIDFCVLKDFKLLKNMENLLMFLVLVFLHYKYTSENHIIYLCSMTYYIITTISFIMGSVLPICLIDETYTKKFVIFCQTYSVITPFNAIFFIINFIMVSYEKE